MIQESKFSGHIMRLLPLTMTMMALMLLVKMNELYIGSKQLREIYGARDAVAEEKKAEEKPAQEKTADHGSTEDSKKVEEKTDAGSHGAPAEEKKEGSQGDAKESASHGEEIKEAGHGEEKESDGHGGAKKEEAEPRTFGTGRTTVKEIEAMKAKDSQPRFSQSELDVLQNLSKRRDELDEREKDLAIKSKVLEATEKRINDKIVEMKTLETELTKVITQYNEKEDEQIKSLVKIYENMKPDEAAAIFNEMEMPILLEVISKMSERKVAPVLANMSPKKAKDVTQELAEKRKRAEIGLSQASGSNSQPAAGR